MLHKLTPILLIALLSYSTTAIASSCGSVYDDKLGWLQEVEVASGQAEPLREVPGPITVITSQMIKDIGAKNLKDVLITYVPGITFVQDHNEVNVAGRGVYTSSQQKMLMMLNGHRLNSRSFLSANPDYSISLNKVECIEVLRTPGSSLYGNVVTNVINIITKKGTDMGGTEISVGLGNYGQRKLSFVHGNEFENGKSDLLLWANYYKSDGESVSIPKEKDYSREPKDSSAILDGFKDPGSYDVGISYEFGDFTLLANQRASKYIEPFSSGGLTGETYNYYDYRTLQGQGPGQMQKFSHLGLDFDKELDNALSLELQFYYDKYEHTSHKIDNPTQKEHSFLAWYEQAFGFITQLRGSYNSGSPQDSTWMVGLQEDRMEVYDSELITGTDGEWTDFSDKDKRDNKVLDTGRERITSGFFHIKHSFSEQWLAQVGMRFDRKKRHKGKKINDWSPRLALIWVPNDQFDLKASYSRAFMDAPHWYRHSSLPSYEGAESLEPEYMESYQITPTVKLLEGKLTSSFNFFYNKFSDFIWRNPGTHPQYQNAGFLTVSGIENDTSYRGTGYNIALNLTYLAAENAENYPVAGESIYNIPNFTGNLILNVNPFEFFAFKPESVSRDLWLNLTARYIGEQLSPVDITFPNGTVFKEPNKEVDDVLLFNTGFRWDKFWNGFFLDGRLYNLFDKQYYQGGSVSHPYPQPGRWWMLTLGYQGDFL